MAVQALIPIGMWVYRIGMALYKTPVPAVAARLVQAGGKLVTKLPKPKPGGRPGDGAKDITPTGVGSVKQFDKIVGYKPGQGANVKTQILSDAKEQVQADMKRLDDLRKKEEKRTKTLSSESRRQKSQVKVTKLPRADPAARPGNVKPKAVTTPVRKGDGTGAGVTGVTPVRKGDGTGAGTKKAKKALNNSAEAPLQTLQKMENEMQALQAARTADRDKIKKMRAESAQLLEDTKPKPSTKEEVEAAMGGNYNSVRTRRSGKFNKRGVGFAEGGLTKKKPTLFLKSVTKNFK